MLLRAGAGSDTAAARRESKKEKTPVVGSYVLWSKIGSADCSGLVAVGNGRTAWSLL